MGADTVTPSLNRHLLHPAESPTRPNDWRNGAYRDDVESPAAGLQHRERP